MERRFLNIGLNDLHLVSDAGRILKQKVDLLEDGYWRSVRALESRAANPAALAQKSHLEPAVDMLMEEARK